MFTMVYKSQAEENLDDAAIEKIVQDTKARNKKKNITGFFLYHAGEFIQLLEGEENAVKALFDKIKKDQRHRKVRVLSMEESVLRIFANWSMIYSKIKDTDPRDQSKKRQLFDTIFHSSNAVFAPGNSKLVLWMQVNQLLNKQITPAF